MKRAFLIYISLFFTSLCLLKAQTASIENIWLEHGVTQNGTTGINVHLKFNIQGMKDQKGRVIAYFDRPQGTGIKDLNGKYCTSSGTVCTSKDICPRYDNSIYEDLSIFIPIAELHLSPGKHTYYCRAFIQNLNSGKFLTHSQFTSFDGTGPSNPVPSNSNINSLTVKRFPNKESFYYTNTQHSGLVKANFYYDNQNDPVCSILAGTVSQFYWWGSNSDNGLEFYGFEYKPETQTQASPYGPIPITTYTGRTIKSKNSKTFSLSPDYNKLVLNGYVYNVRISYQEYQRLWNQLFGNSNNPTLSNLGGSTYKNNEENISTPQNNNHCKYCRGTGNCSSCKGKGYKFNSYSGHYDTCPSCNGNGRCFNCHGSGRQR